MSISGQDSEDVSFAPQLEPKSDWELIPSDRLMISIHSFLLQFGHKRYISTLTKSIPMEISLGPTDP